MTATHEARILSPKYIIDPFSQKNEVQRLLNRVSEGYFGPTSTYDRSPLMQATFNKLHLSGPQNNRIEQQKNLFSLLLSNETFRDESTLNIQVKVGDREIVQEVPWTREFALEYFRQQWKSIPKGGAEELRWTEDAIAFAAAGFEAYQKSQGKTDFSLHNNQLYYIIQLLLNKGHYDFGSLETDARGVELPTGEGKTYGFGLAAGIMALRDEKVHIIEPNYISAINHAGQMEQFYETFFNMQAGVATSVPEQQVDVFADSIDPTTGRITRQMIRKGAETRNYIGVGGKLHEQSGVERKKTWAQQIVFTDTETIAGNWLADNQIGSKEKTGIPDLKVTTALVAEGDDTMIDSARNSYIIAKEVEQGQKWDSLARLFDLDKLYPPEAPDQEKRDRTQKIAFYFWANLCQKKSEGYFTEGEGKDYIIAGRQFKGADDLYAKATNVAVESLRNLFGYDEQEEQEYVFGKLRKLFLPSSFAHQDLHTQDGLDNMIANVKQAFIFKDKKREEKVCRLINNSIKRNKPINVLYSEIEDIAKKDYLEQMREHYHVLTERSKDLTNSDIEKALSIFSPTQKKSEDGKITFPSNREVMKELLEWLGNTPHFVSGATDVLFGMKDSADFITGKKPILLDEYGFPLEKRHLPDEKQLFLQLRNIWEKEKLGKDKPITANIVQEIINKYADTIEVSQTTDRVTVPVLFKQYGRLRFSSGSLIPASSTFATLYNAEVVGVSRNIPTQEGDYSEKQNAILTRCLDGGIAQVQFAAGELQRYIELVKKAREIQSKGNTGLFIVPDIEFAKQLNKLIPEAEIATGEEEIAERGTLDRVTSHGTAGKIIITTWIAHRDIDVQLDKNVRDAGGLDCVVCGLLPTERGLWQALQRSIRGDVLGTRTLLLTPDDFSPMMNSNLLNKTFVSPIPRDPEIFHRYTKDKMQKAWEGALEGNIDAMQSLYERYILYLRVQEEQMKTQLIHAYIRDNHLEGWKKRYLKRQNYILDGTSGNTIFYGNPYRRLVEEEARKKGNTGGGGYILIPQNVAHSQSLSAERSQTYENIHTQHLQEGWGKFIHYVEGVFPFFLTDPINNEVVSKNMYDQLQKRFEVLIDKQFNIDNVPVGEFDGDIYIPQY